MSRPLVLALGNNLLGDDGVGIAAARRLKEELPAGVDVEETSTGGLDLLDYLEGRQRVLLLDALVSGRHPPGTILELTRGDFEKGSLPSPHYAGLPDVLALAERLQIPLPGDLRILAMEVERPAELRTDLSPLVWQTLPRFVDRAREVIRSWGPPGPGCPAAPAPRPSSASRGKGGGQKG